MTHPNAFPYSEGLVLRICEALAASEQGIRAVLASSDEFPSIATWLKWTHEHAFVASSYAQAKRQQMEMLAEDIIDISRDESLDPQDKRIRIDSIKWLLSKLVAKTYGDKLDVTSGGEALAPPSHQIDARIQSIIMQAQARKQGALVDAPTLPPEAQSLLE